MFSFIWDSITFLAFCWWICLQVEWFFLSSCTTCRFTFACVFSAFCRLLYVCVRALSWACAWFYCSVKTLLYLIEKNKTSKYRDFIISVGTLVRRWTPSSNQRWTARHYLFTRLAHPVRLTTTTSSWWLGGPFQLTVHSRINDYLIDHIISRLYLMTFNDYVTDRVSSMWAEYLACERSI